MIEKSKQTLNNMQKFMHLLYDQVYDLEDNAECRKVLTDIRSKLDSDFDEYLKDNSKKLLESPKSE